MDFKNLKNLLDDFVSDGYAPGNTIAVFKDGENVFNYSSGYSDAINKKAMTGNEHFFLWSCSKPVTVVAAMQLLEKGKFLLSDPLYSYLPEFSDMTVRDENGNIKKAENTIKILNLFNMTAGFSYETEIPALKKAREITGGLMNTDVVIKCLSEEPLYFEPGEMFDYSLCHDVLARLVEVISGKKFRDYVKENIFEPLGMKRSVYHLTPEIEKNMAVQYRFFADDNNNKDIVESQKTLSSNNGVFKDVGLDNYLIFGPEYDSGGAGIISTVSDYALFAAALANKGMGLTGERILSPASIELIKTNTLTDSQRKTFTWTNLKGYGYGLGVRTHIDKAKSGSLSSVGEFGWGGAAGATLVVDTEKNLGAVYLKHTLNPREPYYMPRVINALYSCI